MTVLASRVVVVISASALLFVVRFEEAYQMHTFCRHSFRVDLLLVFLWLRMSLFLIHSLGWFSGYKSWGQHFFFFSIWKFLCVFLSSWLQRTNLCHSRFSPRDGCHFLWLFQHIFFVSRLELLHLTSWLDFSMIVLFGIYLASYLYSFVSW